MSNDFLSSKVVIGEEEPKLRSINPVATAVLGCVGVTERGPVDVATLVNSMSEYSAIFGGATANGDVFQALDGFFNNGGSTAYVVRTVHHSDPTDPTTKTSVKATKTINDRAGSPIPTLKLDAKSDGTWGNFLKATIAAPTSGKTTEFNLTILLNGLAVESWPNLSMTDADPNYVETVINHATLGSKYVVATDLDSATAAPGDLPALGTTAFFASGADGLGSLADTDFSGGSGANGKTGLRALDAVLNLSLLIVPGRATSAVQNAMITYCEVTRGRQAFAILDPPAATSASGMVTYVDTTAALGGLSEFGAIFWPRIKVVNPNKTVFGSADNITVAPSGHIAGVFARIDGSVPGGVYVPPAGIDNGVLFGCVGFETDDALDEDKRDLIYPRKINPLTSKPGQPRYIDGVATLKDTGNFPTIAERRGAIFIEQSIKAGLEFARHKNNTPALRAGVARTVTAFLLIQMRNNAFRSSDPATAFFVDFGEALNPTSEQFVRKLNGRVGLATAKPAEFISVLFSQDTRAFQEELAATT